MRTIRVIGAGPAGAASALAALQHGAAVILHERSSAPKHKVCGEFLSPGVAPLLDRLGAWSDFAAAGPAQMRRLVLRVGRAERRASLPDVAYGLSRYRLDRLLLDCALRHGSELTHDAAPEQPAPAVLATGRNGGINRDGRIFGFKAHFSGPSDDAVELFFFRDGYTGVSPIEAGLTNVCGLTREEDLKAADFQPEALIRRSPPLCERLNPLRRVTDWRFAGPLVFGGRFHARPESAIYTAGDALCFVDPFTGSGMLNALITGTLAGKAAAAGSDPAEYLGHCRHVLAKPAGVAAILRRLLMMDWADTLALLAPARLLFHLTRPGV